MKTYAKRTEPSDGGLSNPCWRYISASHTDLRQRFERIRVEQRAQKAFAEKQQAALK